MLASERLPRSQLAAILLIVMVLGFLFAVQVRSEASAARYLQNQDTVSLGLLLTGLYQANKQLVAARADVAQAQDHLGIDLSSNAAGAPALQQQLDRLRVIDGAVPVHGPGIELSVNFRLEAFELQDLTNALRQLGAEAVAINGHRVLASSVIEIRNGKVLVDGTPLTTPLRIDAVGDAPGLSDGMQPVVASLTPRGAVGLAELTDVRLPAIAQPRPVVYATFGR